MRIPDVSEIVDAHLFANRLAERTAECASMLDLSAADRLAEQLLEGGARFRDGVLAGMEQAGIDVMNALELLLAIKRLGPRRLEEMFGPGKPEQGQPRGRAPVVRATTVAALDARGRALADSLDPAVRQALKGAQFTVCVACTDVHEYGKLLVEAALQSLGVSVVDAGTTAEPDTVAALAKEGKADFIAISTYNGVALPYLRTLRNELERVDLDMPVFIGGKLNQVPDDGLASMPRDVSEELRQLGAFVCRRVEDMLTEMAGRAEAVWRRNTSGRPSTAQNGEARDAEQQNSREAPESSINGVNRFGA